MRKKYDVPYHVKQFIKKELYNYRDNEILIEQLKEDILYPGVAPDGQPKGNKTSNPTEAAAEKLISTRTLLIAEKKVRQVKKALDRLLPEEKDVVELIFFEGHSQIYAQMHDNIGKDTYYHAMNKMIYFTAVEYGEI